MIRFIIYDQEPALHALNPKPLPNFEPTFHNQTTTIASWTASCISAQIFGVLRRGPQGRVKNQSGDWDATNYICEVTGIAVSESGIILSPWRESLKKFVSNSME